MSCSFFDAQGRLIACYEGTAYRLNDHTDHACLIGLYQSSQWLSGGKVVERPRLRLTCSSQQVRVSENVVITDIPAGCQVDHPDGRSVITDGEFIWSANVPDTYALRFECFPYLSQTIMITVEG